MLMDIAPTGASPEARPMCQEHGERVAEGTCTRCGRFVCGSCVGEYGVCPECVRRQVLSLPSTAPRARWTIHFLSAHVAVDVLAVLLNLWALSSGPSVLRDVVDGLVGVAAMVISVGSAIAFLRWLHLTVRQAEALGIGMRVTPALAVGYWFIPFANLVKPYHVIRRLLNQLGGQSLVDAARVGTWWGVWIVGNVLSQIEVRLTLSGGLDAPTSSAAYALGTAASVMSIVGALLCIGVVRTIQQSFEAKRPGFQG